MARSSRTSTSVPPRWHASAQSSYQSSALQSGPSSSIPSDNWAKYNMGFFIGNKAWRPQYICWKNEGDPIRLMQVRMVQPLNVKTK